jgi:carbamoyl-phosphate synthase large subunit
VLWCLGGFALLIDPARHGEARLTGVLLRLFGAHGGISSAPGEAAFLVVGPNGQPVLAELTAGSSVLTGLLVLSALGLVVLRERVQAVPGFLVAAGFMVAANQARLIVALLAGHHLNPNALVFLDGRVGALVTFAYTLIGLIIMIHVTMHDAERAEQDAKGQHTAARPDGWASPGLGYRVPGRSRPRRRRVRIAAFLHRIAPWRLSDRMAQSRERNRVDYRVGHLDAAGRAAAVQELVARGLAVHTATLIAVASHETDPVVLDALAEAVAARQWEPVSHRQVAALRLWARAWLMRAPAAPAEQQPTARLVAVTGAGGPAGVAVIRALRAAGDSVLALDASPDAAGLRLGTAAAVLPRADADDYAAVLLRTVIGHRPVALICTLAEEYAAVATIADELTAAGCRTWLPPASATETCLDKVAFATALTAAGVPHPLTTTTEQAAALTPGPWVVKPARGRGSGHVRFAATPEELALAFAAGPDAIAQTRLTGREFTADALVDRDGTLVTCVPRWRDETTAGTSVRGRTFDSTVVTQTVAAALGAVGLTGPANVRGFVADPWPLVADPEARVGVGIVEVNPRFSGGLPLTLAAGADVVGTYLTGILAPTAPLPRLTFRADVRMARHFAEVYSAADGTPVADPLLIGGAR